ncbi:MAG: linear amide C-N hydrolase [Gammaproteobacteria bacterium]|nr:linear amide C-N hydrolase [Gammaproteobacteria bacterium]
MSRLLIAILIFINSGQYNTYACTKLMWNTEDFGVFIARSEDFDFETIPTLEVRAKGQSYISPGEASNVAKWTSKYSSIMVTLLGITSVEGFNEKGLSISALSLNEDSDEPVTNNNEQELINILIIPYALDNFASVKEAITGLEKLRIYRADMNEDTKFDGHYVLQDKFGDSAVIEITDGKFHAYHNKKYNVFTNSPTYDQHLAAWEKAKPENQSQVSGLFPLPGNTSSQHRYIRGKYMLEAMPLPTSYINGILKINSALPTVAVSIVGGMYKGKPYTTATQYTVAYNLDEKIMHIRYQYGDTFTQYKADFKQLDDGKNYVLDATDPELAGDITSKFNEQIGIMKLYKQ